MVFGVYLQTGMPQCRTLTNGEIQTIILSGIL